MWDFDFDRADLLDTEATATFRTHANYLHAFATLIRDGPTDDIPSTLANLARRLSAVIPTGAAEAFDEAVLESCLSRAWGTELLLAMGRRLASEDELLRLTNSWGAVQAYYVAYSVTQALIVADGRARPEQHPATQRQAVDLWVMRGYTAAPWSFAMAAPANTHAAADGSINGPGRPLREIHNWSACGSSTCWDIAANALRSTRQDAVIRALVNARTRKLDDRRKAWRRDDAARVHAGRKPRKEPQWPGQAKLTREESGSVQDGVRPYTILDYLFRLRVKANYEDATVFTEGPEDERATTRVAYDLELIASATCLAHELRIGRLVGRARLLDIVDAWLDVNGAAAKDLTVAARRELLGECV